MTLTNLPTLVVYAADANHVTFGRGTLSKVTVTMKQAADALTNAIGDGRSILGGYAVDESELTALMNTMRDADPALSQCGRCGRWTDTGALCPECAQDIYDVRHEKLADRAAQWEER